MSGFAQYLLHINDQLLGIKISVFNTSFNRKKTNNQDTSDKMQFSKNMGPKSISKYPNRFQN